MGVVVYVEGGRGDLVLRTTRNWGLNEVAMRTEYFVHASWAARFVHRPRGIV
jgi:hypothetical protein